MQVNPDLLIRRLRREIDAWQRQDNLDQLRARIEQDDWEAFDR
jgi:hypothetical protein